MKRIFLIIVISIMYMSCATKPDVVVIDGNTYIFSKGVENFYIIDPGTGGKKEITK